jgi:glyoxylase-like metal-dependent hydrolase (beta-lactamase superfamily II)
MSRQFAAALVTAGFLAAGCDNEQETSELIQPSEWWQVHPRPVYTSLDKVGTYQGWFDVSELAGGTFAIYEPNQFEEAISYLVLGEERGVLIDAGTGIGNIKQVVEELTDLPVSSLLTHEHYDHIGGAHRFEEIIVFDNPVSLERLAAGRDNANLRGYVTADYLWKPLPEGFDPATWTIPPIEPTRLLHDRDIVDLGGRQLEAFYTPGHSPGSMCLLDRANRLLWTGDHFYPGPLYAHADDVNMDDYAASNARLAAMVSEFDYVLSGHNDPWIGSDVIPRVSDAFDAILGGTADYAEDGNIRRYHFDGFDVLIRADQVQH